MESAKVKCDYKFCRGITSECRFSLVDEKTIADDIKQAVENSNPPQTAAIRSSLKPVHHRRLRVAMAACPNACTMPQIRDIGIIANITPTAIGPDCNGCGQCEGICREQAIIVRNSKARLVPQNCVGCGQCIKVCSQHTIASDGLKFRILAGGRMGRHPRWAKQICIVNSSTAAGEVKKILENFDSLSDA